MKATGIVRRIDETAIIGPSQKNLAESKVVISVLVVIHKLIN